MKTLLTIKFKPTLAVAVIGVLSLPMAARATDYTWSNASSSNWGTAGNWSPAGGPPGPADNVVTPSAFGQANLAGTSQSISSLTFNAASNWNIVGSAGTSSLALSGSLSKAGAGILTIRGAGGATATTLSVGGDVSVSGGALRFGERFSSSLLNNLSIGGGVSLSSSGTISFNLANTGTVSGVLSVSGSSRAYIAHGAAGSSSSLRVGALTSTDNTGVLAANDFNVGTNTTGTLIIAGASGTATYSGAIKSSQGTSSGSVLNVQKTGGNTQIFSGNNTYTGVTTVTAGTLLVNGAHTGGGAYSVSDGGTLGGTGAIGLATNVSATIGSGGLLSGDSQDNLVFNLAGTGILDVAGAVGSGSSSMLFTLGAPSTTVISISGGGLSIGTGVMEFSDFAFTPGSGFDAGTYTLFGGANALTGTLGLNLSGSINGSYDGVISLSGNNVILTVSAVPEPGTASTALVFGLGLLVTRRMIRRPH